MYRIEKKLTVLLSFYAMASQRPAFKMGTGHFGPKTFRTQDTLDLKICGPKCPLNTSVLVRNVPRLRTPKV